jgi:hypothetical protein
MKNNNDSMIVRASNMSETRPAAPVGAPAPVAPPAANTAPDAKEQKKPQTKPKAPEAKPESSDSGPTATDKAMQLWKDAMAHKQGNILVNAGGINIEGYKETFNVNLRAGGVTAGLSALAKAVLGSPPDSNTAAKVAAKAAGATPTNTTDIPGKDALSQVANKAIGLIK